MSNLQHAAHVKHPISHTSNSGGWVGAGVGIVGGAALIFFTAGAATPAVIAAMVGAGALGGSIGAQVGEALDNGQEVAGGILDGARTVFLAKDRRRAAMADKRTRVSCHDPQFVRRGSKTVFIENKNASRRYDGTTCGGQIAKGDRHILVGGESVAIPGYENVDEDRGWLRTWRGYALLAAGITASAPMFAGGKATWWALESGADIYGSTDLPGADAVGTVMTGKALRDLPGKVGMGR